MSYRQKDIEVFAGRVRYELEFVGVPHYGGELSRDGRGNR